MNKETLSEKIQYIIEKVLPEKEGSYELPNVLKKELEQLEMEEDQIAIKYLEESIKSAKQVAANNEKWNRGWRDNLDLYEKTKDTNMLAPLYSGKLPYLRLFRRLYKTKIRNTEKETSNTLEHRLYSELYDEAISKWIYKYCKEQKVISKQICIVELGAGSCQHIPRLNKRLQRLDKEIQFIAADWSTTTGEICTKLEEYEGFTVNYMRLNLLEDLNLVKLPHNCFVYTVNALEQIGNRVGPVIDWLNEQKPKLVIHFEPIQEVLESYNRYDKKSIDYMQERGYLDGLYSGLLTRQSKDELNIIRCERTFISNAHHENNTFICWASK